MDENLNNNYSKNKYSLFKTIKFFRKWLIKNYIIFLIILFFGSALMVLIDYYFAYWEIIYSILYSFLTICIITIQYLQYKNRIKIFKCKLLGKLFLISLIFFIYNFFMISITFYIEKIFQNAFFLLYYFLSIAVLIIISLSIIDVINNYRIIGLKFGVKIFFKYLKFFIKNILFMFFILIIIVILSSHFVEFRQVGRLLVNIFTVYIVIIFISENNKENNIYCENLYVA